MSVPAETQNPVIPSRHIWIGIGVGMIPVVLGWIAIGFTKGSTNSVSTAGSALLFLMIGLYVAKVIGAITFLFIRRFKGIGYGLLIMVFVGPILWATGCIVILNA